VDDARLTLNIARTAAFHAAVTNHAQVTESRAMRGKVDGAIIQADGREIRVRAGVVIMATGVWLRDWTGEREEKTLHIRPAKGVTSPFRGSRSATTAR
jgi:glycerol-3-phosphate dehydrogenase